MQQLPAAGRKLKPPLWQIAEASTVATSVGFSVLLISVAYGVRENITHRLSDPRLQEAQLVNVNLIDRILTLLVFVVLAAMLVQTATATFVIGVTLMHTRREEIAVRRQSGVLRSRLLREFVWSMLPPCIFGGVVGEALGAFCGSLLRGLTVLPVQFTAVSLLAAFPVTIALALAATLIPAWRSANISPGLLRKE